MALCTWLASSLTRAASTGTAMGDALSRAARRRLTRRSRSTAQTATNRPTRATTIAATATLETMLSGITDDILGWALDSPAMTKKVRGAPRAHRRPGTRPATDRSNQPRRRPVPIERPSQLEATEEAAEDVIEDRPAAAAAVLEASARSHPRHRVKAGSLLATRAATEYVYVAKDMRRILFVAALLLVIMF